MTQLTRKLSQHKKAGKMKKIHISFMLIISILLLAFAIEQITRYRVGQKYSPQGAFQSVNNHQIHYLTKGSGAGTVLFESALGEGLLYWSEIQDSISQYNTTLSYDRSGIGWSERGSSIKSCHSISEELEELLDSLSLPKPYTLVAHSIGGLTLRPFIRKHKNDIKGIVFIDVSHKDQLKLLPSKSLIETVPSGVIHFANSIGIARYLFGFPYPGKLVSDTMNTEANDLRYKSMATSIDEANALQLMVSEVNAISDFTFDSIPFTIITGTSPHRYDYLKDSLLANENERVWNQLQRDYLNLSSQSKQVLARKSGHFVHTEEPQLVIESILELLRDEDVQ